MDYLAQFKIPFVGLAFGEHKFEYNIDDQFFSKYDHAVISKSKLHIELLFNKQETMLLLDFHITGEIEVVCDRCANNFNLPVEHKTRLIVKLGDEEKELSENMVMINRNNFEINIAQYIYEFVSLLMPQRIVHPDNSNGKSACDKKTLQAIKKLETKTHEADPRWEVLKNLNLDK